MIKNRILICLLLLIMIPCAVCQSYFTVPQNVWRVSISSKSMSGDWIGDNGLREVGKEEVALLNHTDRFFEMDSSTIQGTLTESRFRNAETITSIFEYGFSEKSTFRLEIPYWTKYYENESWKWASEIENDTEFDTILDKILDYYHPKSRYSSGFGDISIGMKFLLFGVPAWSANGVYSAYAGFTVQIPSSRPLSQYKFTNEGRPSQFEEVTMGSGTTLWKFALFGEFYKKTLERLFTINWFTELIFSSREVLNTPVFFPGLQETNPDSLAERIGLTYFYKKGTGVRGELSGAFDLWPKRITLKGTQSWYYKNQDQFISKDIDWDNRMSSNDGYDTKQVQISQSLVVYLNNLDPIKRIGPIPFIIEIGVKVPLLTRNKYNGFQKWIGFTTYYQWW